MLQWTLQTNIENQYGLKNTQPLQTVLLSIKLQLSKEDFLDLVVSSWFKTFKKR
jgi:hypothetical protein